MSKGVRAVNSLEEKLDLLKNIIAGYGGVIVAYSGGVDSTYLAKVASDVLGENSLAVTASSETYPRHEVDYARELAHSLGLRHQIIYTEELDNKHFAANPPERCYICKNELFGKLVALAKQHNLPYVIDGSNCDDLSDFRPGARAGRELGIKSPLQETGFTKEDIRQLSKTMGLPTWNKPSFACLSSRFPYGEQITREKLIMVSNAEDYLRSLGVKQLRVRHHDKLARIELAVEDFNKILDVNADIVQVFKKIGYKYITLDLHGYRTGSMNEVLESDIIEKERPYQPKDIINIVSKGGD
ncbi:MAG TPA: ATP-dependent sacrificial sulfur transferase LarE [Candidatus Limnocylindrales bacterium]|nr:ATP-dependent sacrificial sulfur transferase LarE [Candidatus Limnocylindrales bacterium]